MVKSDNVVPCKYVSASPLAQILFEKLFSFIRFVFPHWASNQLSPKFEGLQPISVKLNGIWYHLTMEMIKRPWINIPTQKKKSEHLLVNDSCPVRPVW